MNNSSNSTNFFVHPQALCESETVGDNTKIWAFAHVMKGAVIGSDCNLCDYVFIESHATVGSRVVIKNLVQIWEGVHIADDCFIGPGVMFTNDMYPRSSRGTFSKDRYRLKQHWLLETHVEVGASIGALSVILPGVSVGAYSMIAAGSIITKDVKPHSLMVGNPAKCVGYVCKCGFKLSSTPDPLLNYNCHQCANTI